MRGPVLDGRTYRLESPVVVLLAQPTAGVLVLESAMSATQRELLEERWTVLMTDTQRFKDEHGISTVNSKRYRRIADTIEELGVLLAGETMGNEAESLQYLVAGDIMDTIHDRLVAWAEMVEASRADYGKVLESYKVVQ